jgi:hypothetical protein
VIHLRTPITLALLALALAPATGRASIMFTQSPVATDVNVLGITPLTATTAQGRANASSDYVINIATDTPLVAPASGASRVEAASPSALFTTVDFTPVAGFGFSVLEINPQVFSPRGATGTFTLTAVDQFGVQFTSGTLDLGNGDNRVAAVASGGELITSLMLTASGPIVADVRQIRLTAAEVPATVPEPSTMATSVIGAGSLCLAGFRRMRRRAASR